MPSIDSFKSRSELTVNGKTYTYYSLEEASKNGLGDVSTLPASLKVLLENLLRNEDGVTVTQDDIKAFAGWLTDKGSAKHEIAYRPARVFDAGLHRSACCCRLSRHARRSQSAGC